MHATSTTCLFLKQYNGEILTTVPDFQLVSTKFWSVVPPLKDVETVSDWYVHLLRSPAPDGPWGPCGPGGPVGPVLFERNF